MNPGLVVKLRPTGPWRIGPDTGARNRVDVVYHSDSLYGAVTSAMTSVGLLEEWLGATACAAEPAVTFGSCFPLVEEIAFVIPPRTLWPPTSVQALSARVRWKSARFIPLSLVESMLAGKRLNDNQWTVDGPSGCLLPNGKLGPFRTSVRWNAAVDRLSGASERHSTACIEFREGCGMWTVVSFRDSAARDTWQERVKAAFRLLADGGFGGERSRGWGRSDVPEFVEGTLPGMIVQYRKRQAKPEIAVEVEPARPATEADEIVAAAVAEAAAEVALASEAAVDAVVQEHAAENEGMAAGETVAEAAAEAAAASEAAIDAVVQEHAAENEGMAVEDAPLPDGRGSDGSAGTDQNSDTNQSPDREGGVVGEQTKSAGDGADAASSEPASFVAEVHAPRTAQDLRVTPEPAHSTAQPPATSLQAHWLLSLYTPASADAVDWARGSYAVTARGGRVDSPSGSGELKKQIQMVAEGSVLYADGTPLGAAPDVAPDGFAHPVFRAGFALAIPLPEVH